MKEDTVLVRLNKDLVNKVKLSIIGKDISIKDFIEDAIRKAMAVKENKLTIPKAKSYEEELEALSYLPGPEIPNTIDDNGYIREHIQPEGLED